MYGDAPDPAGSARSQAYYGVIPATLKPDEVATAMKQVIQVARNKDLVEKARGLLNRTGTK